MKHKVLLKEITNTAVEIFNFPFLCWRRIDLSQPSLVHYHHPLEMQLSMPADSLI